MILEKLVRHVKNEGRRLTLDDPSGWNTGGPLFGGRELQAMKLPAVNACIEIISDSVAKMPIYLMDSGTRERQADHPALRLLTSRPTEAMTAFDYHKLMESRRIAYGNAYALIWRDRWGAPAELLPIAPGYMQPYLDDNGRLWYVGTNPRTGEYRKFWPADVLHYKAFSTDGLEGVSYLRRGAETIEAALQAQKYEVGFYKNGAKLTGILYTETDLTNKPDIKQADGTTISIKDAIRREWENLYTGADNAFRTAVMDFGMKYTPVTASNRDAQFIESNVQAAIEYMQRTLSPIVAEHEQEDTYKLLLASEQARGLQLRRNMMGELRGDWAARAAWFKSMREIGAYSINNILALEDMPDIAGGDEHYASLNYIPADLFRELSINRNEPKERGENK